MSTVNCNVCQFPPGNPSYRLDIFEVLGSHTVPHGYISVSLVRCKSCKARYYVIEDPGYHQPSYTWTTDTARIEQLTGQDIEKLFN